MSIEQSPMKDMALQNSLKTIPIKVDHYTEPNLVTKKLPAKSDRGTI